MDTRLAALETRFDTILPTLATKADFAELKSELHANITVVTRWMLATVIGLFFGFAGLFYAVSSNQRSDAPANAPAIIINVPGTATPPASTHP
jgi:hypothetical protein